MKIALFDARRYDRNSFDAVNAAFGHGITYREPRLRKPLSRA